MPKIAELPAHNSDFCGKSIGRALPPFSSAYRYFQRHRKSFPICPADVQNASVFVRTGRAGPWTVCKFPAKPELFLKISFFSPYCDFCNRHTVFPLLSYFSYSVGKETAHGLYAFGRSADRPPAPSPRNNCRPPCRPRSRAASVWATCSSTAALSPSGSSSMLCRCSWAWTIST